MEDDQTSAGILEGEFPTAQPQQTYVDSAEQSSSNTVDEIVIQPKVHEDQTAVQQNNTEVEEQVKKICIDSDSDEESPNDEINRNSADINFGLSYSDHNYAIPGKAKSRTFLNASLDQSYPTISNLDEHGNPDSGVHTSSSLSSVRGHLSANINDAGLREPHIVGRSVARDSAYRVASSDILGPPTGYTRTVTGVNVTQARTIIPARNRTEGTPATGQVVYRTNTASYIQGPHRMAPVVSQNQYTAHTTPAIFRRTIPARTPISTQRPATTTTIRNVSMVRTQEGEREPFPHTEMASLPQRRVADVAPHRMTQEQRIQQQQLAASRPAFAVNEGGPMSGHAPMLVPARGSKMLVRGRGGSQGARTKKDSEENEQRDTSASPRKNQPAHFIESEPAENNEQIPAPVVPTTAHHAVHIARIGSSPQKQHSLIARPTPPHRMTAEERSAHYMRLQEKDPRPKIPVSVVEPQPGATNEHPTVESVDQKHREPDSPRKLQQQQLEALEVKQLAESLRMECEGPNAVVEKSSSEPVWVSKDLDEDSIKAKIEQIRREIQEEQHQKEILGMMANVQTVAEKRRSGGSAGGAGRVEGDHGDKTLGGEQRPRGRPKGSVANSAMRNRYSASSGSEGDLGAQLGHPLRLAGSGVRMLSPNAQRAAAAVAPINISSIPFDGNRRTITVNGAHNASSFNEVNGSRVSIAAKDSDSESDAENSNQQEEEYGNDWTMRCYCGLTHSEGFTIECEQCKDWQHGHCMGLSEDDENEGYVCEKCRPRKMKISVEQARKIQLRNLREIEKQNQKQKRNSLDKKFKTKRGRKSKENLKKDSITPVRKLEPSKSRGRIEGNDYSRKAIHLLTHLSSTVGADKLLEDAKKYQRAKRLFLSSKTEGLVSVEEIESRVVVMELVGSVCMPDECGRDVKGSLQSFIFEYDGLMKGPLGEDIGRGVDNQNICIDARQKGNDSKFVRRSCSPNCVLKHVLDGTTLGVMIVATKPIARATEITIPFDLDWVHSRSPLQCAQHDGNMKLCEYEKMRVHQNPQFAEQIPPEVPVEKEEEKVAIEEPKPANSPKVEEQTPIRQPSTRTLRASTSTSQTTEVKEEDTKKDEVDDSSKKKKGRASRVKDENKDKKEEEKKEEKKPRDKKKEDKKEAQAHLEVDYTLPADRNKMSRDERKYQAMVAQFAKMEEQEKKKSAKIHTPKSPTKDSKTRRESTSATESEPERKSERRGKSTVPSTSFVAPEEKQPATPTREASARQRKKRESETSTPAVPVVEKTLPPRKRWAADAAAEAAASGEGTSSPRVPPMKKQWLKRHAAETKQNDENGTSPSKKTRRNTETIQEKPKTSIQEALTAMHHNATQGRKRSDFSISLADGDKPSHSLPTVRFERSRETKESTSKVAEPEKVVEIPLPSPPKKVVKKLSIDDYKKRRSVATEDVGAKKDLSFIPSGEASGSGVELAQFVPPDATPSTSVPAPATSNVKPSLSELRNEILGKASLPKTPISTVEAPSVNSVNEAGDETGNEPIRHAMSLSERLRTEFGIGGGASERKDDESRRPRSTRNV